VDNEVITQTKADREILSFDVSDELLERAANVEKSGFTLSYCTSYWNSCGLPSIRQIGDVGRDPYAKRGLINQRALLKVRFLRLAS
jgi:hypothetical protein